MVFDYSELFLGNGDGLSVPTDLALTTLQTLKGGNLDGRAARFQKSEIIIALNPR